jgi:hypothetical protein
VEIRFVEKDKEVRHDPLSSYKAPIDTLHLASMTGGDSAKFEEFMGMCQRPSALLVDDDDKEEIP